MRLREHTEGLGRAVAVEGREPWRPAAIVQSLVRPIRLEPHDTGSDDFIAIGRAWCQPTEMYHVPCAYGYEPIYLWLGGLR